jgi:predicted GH43/DUF377 family glycosyl hydrolase
MAILSGILYSSQFFLTTVRHLMRILVLLGVVAVVFAGCGSGSVYRDERSHALLRMNALDHGAVFRHGGGPDSCDVYGARDAWVFKAGDTYIMHYDAAGPRGWLCARATSIDLLNWKRDGPVMELGPPGTPDEASASYGVTFHDGSEWHMFYLGTRNASPPPDRVPMVPYLTLKARSSSPFGPWIKQREVVPFDLAPGTYYSRSASPGMVVRGDGEYLQFFSAADGDPQLSRTLGIARTRDLHGTWQPDSVPALPPEEQIENSSLYFEESNGTWFLFTNHVGFREGEEEYTDAIWVYWSRDLTRWNPEHKAVVLDRNNCRWSRRVIGLPSVVRFGNRLALFYDGVEGDGMGHMARDIGLAWLRLPLVAPRWTTDVDSGE